MLYFHKENLVLFATPKAASTALEAVLAPRADIVLQGDAQIKHCTFPRYKWRLEKFISIFAKTPPETVALIREPTEWLGSWYRYRQRDWLRGTDRSTHEMSFDEFVAGYMMHPKPAFAAVGSQATFLTHPHKPDQVETLFRYDAMPDFLRWLEERLQCSLDLPILNVSPALETPLSPALREEIQQFCAQDYALYNRALPLA